MPWVILSRYYCEENNGCLALLSYSVSHISASLIKNTERQAVRLAKPCGPRKTPFYSTGKKCCDFRLSENAGARRIVPELGKRPLLPVFAAILAAPPRINASRDASRRPDGASPTRSGDGRPMRIRGRGADRPDAHTPHRAWQSRQPAEPP